MRFQPQFGIEFWRGSCFLGKDGFGPFVEALVADLLAADAAAVEPQRLAGEAGQGGAVGADRDEGAGEARQPVFEPVDRGKTEVVGPTGIAAWRDRVFQSVLISGAAASITKQRSRT